LPLLITPLFAAVHNILSDALASLLHFIASLDFGEAEASLP